MKTIKEIEKDLMQQDMQKILNKYHNGVYEKEARILQARQNAEASVPFREKIIRRFGIFNRTKEYYESFPQELWEKMIKQDYVRRLCVRAIGTAIIMLYAIYSLFDYLRFTELPELLKAAGGNRLFIVTPIILLLAICGAVAFYCITRGQNKELLGGSLYAVSCGMLALYGAIAAAFGFWIVSQAGFCALLLGPNSIWLTDILALAITGLLPAICVAGRFCRCRRFPLPAVCAAGLFVLFSRFRLFFRGFVLSFCGFRRNIASGVDFRLFLGSVGARLHLLINFFQLIQRVFALFSQFVGVFFHPGDIFVVPFFQLFAEFVHRFRQLAGIVVIVFLGGFGAVIFQFLYRFSGQFQHFVSEDADCFTYRHTC